MSAAVRRPRPYRVYADRNGFLVFHSAYPHKYRAEQKGRELKSDGRRVGMQTPLSRVVAVLA